MSSPYPDYERVREAARTQTPRFVGPNDLARYRAVVSARGFDWCTAVIGRPFAGIGSVSALECQMLLVADAEGLAPPLPETVVAQRAATEAAQDAREETRTAMQQAAAARWAEVLAAAVVKVEVRPNVNSRRTGRGYWLGPLRHAVPLTDAVSGSEGRPRLHPAGRAVCETGQRHRPRQLGEPTHEAVTCVSCLRFVPRLRPAPLP